MRIEELVRKPVKEMKAVNWRNYSNSIRLQWGENPLEVPECVKTAIIDEIKNINYYPDPTKSFVKEVLTSYNDINTSNIILGNGSDELIELIAKTFIEPGDISVIPVPSFPTYENATKLMDGVPFFVELDKDFNLNVDELLNKIPKKTKIIWIGNPNNPTGNILLNKESVEKVLESINCILVVDECYYEFSRLTVVDLIKKYDNLIILRSFSKTFGLAGLRIGYAISSEKIIEFMSRVDDTIQPFNVNSLAQVAALTVLKNYKSMTKKINEFEKNKEKFIIKLSEINGIKVIPTVTSFILIDSSKSRIKSAKLKERLAEKGILIKDCTVFWGLGPFYSRLGIPPENKMDLVVFAIKDVVRSEMNADN